MIYAKTIVTGPNRFYRGHFQNAPNIKTFFGYAFSASLSFPNCRTSISSPILIEVSNMDLKGLSINYSHKRCISLPVSFQRSSVNIGRNFYYVRLIRSASQTYTICKLMPLNAIYGDPLIASIANQCRCFFVIFLIELI